MRTEVTLKTDLSRLQPFDLNQEAVTEFFMTSFTDCVTGVIDLKDVLPLWLEKWGWEYGPDALMEYWFQSQHTIDGQIVWLIKKLRARGYPCYLVTQQEMYRAEYMRNEMGLGELFDDIVTTADVGYTKREGIFYQEVCKRLGIQDATEVIFIDDSEKVLRAAQELGIQTFHYSANFDELYAHVKSMGIDVLRV